MKNPKIKFTARLLSFLLIGLIASAQVGIGTTTPDASSVLDIQSTTKGFLAPRMTTLQRAAISSPEVGLMVFDTDINKFCFYEGSSWIANETNQFTRDNYVLVKTTADLPIAVAGVITLVSGTFYEINGTLVLSDEIDLNGCTLIGKDVSNDKLVYTGSGALFTGTKGGVIKTLTISGNGTNNCFSLNDATKTLNFIFRDSFVANFSSVGDITGFNMILFTTIGFISNTEGITFTSNGYLFLNNQAWFSSNTGTHIKFEGTTKLISMEGGMINVNSGVTGIDVTGLTAVTNDAILSSYSFSGAGTHTAGTFSKEWEIESSGIVKQTDDVATGNLYITSSTNTIITAANTPVKIAGTTSGLNLFRVTSTTDNRLTYTGTKTRFFTYTGSISVTASDNGKRFVFYIAKNGTILSESQQSRKIANGSDRGSISISGVIELETDDYLEVWVENINDSTNIKAQSMNLLIN